MKKLLIIIAAAGTLVAAHALSGHPGEEEYRRALALEDGRGVTANADSALVLLRQAADSGYAAAQNYLGFKYMTDNSMSVANADSALMWIERAAAAGYPGAWNNLGYMLSTGIGGVHPDLEKARYWYSKASASGHVAASSSLARLLLEGKGGPADSLRAEHLLRYAASRGLSDAGEMLYRVRQLDTVSSPALIDSALYYYNHRIYPVAAPLLSRAEACDNPLATAILAFCYSQGQGGFPYDYDLSQRLWLRAAMLGDPSAQFVVAETLDLTPDAWRGADGAVPLPKGVYPYYERRFCAPGASADPSDLPTADEWRAMAAEGGVTDSRQAISRLLPTGPHR